MTAAYATIAMLREYLPQTAQTTAKDDLLRRCLTRARSIIDQELRFSWFDVDTDTGAVDAWPSAAARVITAVPSDHWLRLPAYQAGSVSSLTYINSAGVTTAITDWVEDWNSGPYHLFRASDTTSTQTPQPTTALWANGPYTVTAIWGFGPPIEAIEELNLELAVNIWRTREKGSFAEMGVGQSGAVIKAVGALSKEQRETLAQINALYLDWIDIGRP